MTKEVPKFDRSIGRALRERVISTRYLGGLLDAKPGQPSQPDSAPRPAIADRVARTAQALGHAVVPREPSEQQPSPTQQLPNPPA